jgi:hypothetical protein
MELWSGGVKLANFPGNTIHTNLYLPDFSTVTIVEVDSAGGLISLHAQRFSLVDEPSNL